MNDEFTMSRDKRALGFPHFPTRLQAVVWRNWGLVTPERIALAVGASCAQVTELAVQMGLPAAPGVDPLWLKRGYMTIIRFNWHLLPYEQLLVLLDWSEEQLEFALKEDDFLWIKLGSLKPFTEAVEYRPLTDGELRRTERLREQLRRHFAEPGGGAAEERPFAFLNRFAHKEEAVASAQQGVESAAAAAMAASPDLLAIDESWTIVCPEGTKRVRTFAERFARRHEERWGWRPAVEQAAGGNGPNRSSRASDPEAGGPDAGSGRLIRLALAPDAALLAESHEVHIAEEGIRIQAVDEAGLLRGLQLIARQMARHGAPAVRTGVHRRPARIDLRYVYSYSAVFGDPLLDPELDPYPDGLLEQLSELGVNGIWLQSVLYGLVRWEEAPELSHGCEQRIRQLNRLVERAADYGIRVLLYFNEPRTMPLAFFERHPEWRGHVEGEYATLCTSHPDIRQYLRESTARLFHDVPGLGGLFTITMSENWTNCYSRTPQGRTNCPRCSGRPIQEVVTEVVKTVAEGAFSVNPEARILCWTWGWTPSFGWPEETVMDGVGLLPDGITVMCTSEHLKPTNIAGVPGNIVDYSMSNIGPSDLSRRTWEAANRRGLRSAAKVQFNNTWECSAVPFLPVFDIVEEHLGRLMESGVSALQLSWTLGGYPSPNLELASEYYWDAGDSEPFGMKAVLSGTCGEAAAGRVAAASAAFSRAFAEFPFHLGVVYQAPQNYGPTNLLYLQPTGYESTMLGFPYDDLQGWRSIYPEDKFAGQFGKLVSGWSEGLRLLAEAERHVAGGRRLAFSLLQHAAEGAYLHFYSTYLQISFIRARDRLAHEQSERTRAELRTELLGILDQEIAAAKSLYGIIRRDSRIGYEATNHYYYTKGSLQEKVLNCLHVRESLLDDGGTGAG